MKKYRFWIMVMSLTFIFTLSASAQSDTSQPKKAPPKAFIGERIHELGPEFVFDPKNADVVVRPGITCYDLTELARRHVQNKFCMSLDSAMRLSVWREYTLKPVYGTFWNPNTQRIEHTQGKITTRHVLSLHGEDWLAAVCTQILSSDQGLLDKALAGVDYTDNRTKDCWKCEEETKKTNIQNENKDTTMQTIDINVHGLQDVAQNDLSWWAILLIVLGSIVILGGIIALFARIFREPSESRRLINRFDDLWDLEDRVHDRDEQRARRRNASNSRQNDFHIREHERLREMYGSPRTTTTTTTTTPAVP